MGTNHGGGEGIEVAGAVEHGGARTCLSFHEHLRKIRCQRRNPAPSMPKEDATTVGPADQALGYLVAGGGVRRLEGGERPQSPKRTAAQGLAGAAYYGGGGGGGEARHGGADRRVLDSGVEGGVVLKGKVWPVEVPWWEETRSDCVWARDHGPNCQPSDLESAVGRMNELHQIKILNEMNYIPSKKMKWITSVFLKLTL